MLPYEKKKEGKKNKGNVYKTQLKHSLEACERQKMVKSMVTQN